jgi:5'-3' exonuclease
MSKKNLVLVDAGWFVGRNARHWSPKGGMKRAHYKWIVRAKKPNPFMFVKSCRKIVFNDFQYLDLRMTQMKVSPKFGNSEVIVCYDGINARQRRGLISSAYKGNRAILPDSTTYDAESYVIHDLREDFQKWSINPMHPRHGWTGLYDDYKEADDLIAEQVLEAFKDPAIENIVVFTGDSDIHQLYSWDLPAGKTLQISNVQKVITPAEIETNNKIKISQFVDWKSLTGDTTDNIISIPGLGPVKAAKLITTYGCLDDIPAEQFVRYQVQDADEVAAFLSGYRADNELTAYRVEKDYGYFWKSLESKKRDLLSVEEYASISSLIPAELFLKIDYGSLIQANRVMIQLPFEMPESLTTD